MKRVLGILAAIGVVAAAGVGVWTWHHGPIHITPTLTNPFLDPPPPATPNKYVKAISAASCTSSEWFSGPMPTLGTSSDGTSASVANGGGGTLLLYCDAALPAQAVAFDYAEMEFYAPNVDPYSAPTMTAYLDAELVDSGDAGYFTQSFAIGSCGPAANLTPVYGGNRAISVCQTSGSQPFAANDAGPFAGWTQWGTLRYFSVHFIVQVPSGTPAVAVYRIIVHYEAP